MKVIDPPNAIGLPLFFCSVSDPYLSLSLSRCLSAPFEPHFTECMSRDQETFRCWWSPGSFRNLSSPGALRVFYLKKEWVWSPCFLPGEVQVIVCICESPYKCHRTSFLPLLLLLFLPSSPPSFSSPTSEWKECPEYIHSSRECFFDVNHTSIWIPYCVQLRGQNNITYFNEDDCFTVENIGW